MIRMASLWPLFDLELRTARLVLRPARDDDFPGLLEAVDTGIHHLRSPWQTSRQC
jgi:hypothetical protein